VQLKLESPEGKLTLIGGGEMLVPKEQLATTSVLVELAPRALSGHNTKLKVGVYSNGKRLETVNTMFIGPRDDSKQN
jgi:hypothetical protein